MTAVLLSVHVLAAIVLIGPMTAAASLFPRYARAALDGDVDARGDGAGAAAVARAFHRISRGYAAPALVVPVFGIATAARLDALGQVWLWASVVLTAAAAVLLVVEVIPTQRRALEAMTEGAVAPAVPAALSRLGMTTGLFALSWAVVVVLMILRPGSTTAALR